MPELSNNEVVAPDEERERNYFEETPSRKSTFGLNRKNMLAS
jgi:hypothetical protein